MAPKDELSRWIEWVEFRNAFLGDLEKVLKERFEDFYIINANTDIDMRYRHTHDYLPPIEIRIRPNQARVYLNYDTYSGRGGHESMKFEYNDPDLFQKIVDGVAKGVAIKIKPQYEKLTAAAKTAEYLMNL